jgi:hypothetical protein
MKLRITLVLVSCVLSVLTGLVLHRGGAAGKSGGSSEAAAGVEKKRTRPLIGLSWIR